MNDSLIDNFPEIINKKYDNPDFIKIIFIGFSFLTNRDLYIVN